MATKIITFEDRFSTGEPTVQLVSTWGANGKVLREKTSLHKVASIHSPALDYIKNVEPEPGKSTVLIIGLGDHETYGPNRNGDGFPSEPVPGKIAADEVLTKHYQSYKNAHVYRHHVNNDPGKAIGKVKMAFWNPYMHRVEVVEDFDHGKAPDLLEKIADGEFPAKSMGCRIKYDVCAICGNKAKTRAEYCNCLKYEMGKIDEHTGKQAAALNPSPNFFDSSWVIRPADRTGYMLKKVAYAAPYEIRTGSFELGELADTLKQKVAVIGKAADIEKVINGQPEASVSNLTDKDMKLLSKYKKDILPKTLQSTKPLGVTAIKIIVSHSPGDALETTKSLGMPLSLGELLKYFLGKLSDGEENCTDELIKSASAHLPLVYRLFQEYPRFYDEVLKIGHLEEGKFNAKLAHGLEPYQPQRATSGDYLYRRLVPDTFRTQDLPLTTPLTYTDPVTRQEMTTTVGAKNQMHDALTEQAYKTKALKALPLLGTSALLGAASLGAGLAGNRKASILSGLGSLATGLYGAHQVTKPTELRGPMIMTDQGIPVSGWTEFKGAEAAPELDYAVQRGLDGPTQTLPGNYIDQFFNALKCAEIYDETSPIIGPTLDLDIVALKLGESIAFLTTPNYH